MPVESPVLSVSRLVGLLKETVEENFVDVTVEGELSNLARPSSGHLYFTLKDDRAQLRGVMFRPSARLLRFEPEDGVRLICRGRVSLYSQRGELQLIVDSMEPVGTGSLQLAFEQLKKRLETEGLFAESRKRPIPTYPRRIGIVTSASGAAIHDMLQVLRRRGAGIDVKLWPVRVQGDGAAVEIADAIDNLNRHCALDLVIVGRGGGSLEDLWAFNEEAVARAIAASEVPVVSAVGHEVDVTIADYVADLRAATPTAAAELVTRSRLELEQHVDRLKARLVERLQAQISCWRAKVDAFRRQLVSPEQRLQLWRQRLQELVGRLDRGVTQCRQRHQAALASLSGRLDLLSPLKTLERGYAIAVNEDGVAVQDSSTLTVGDPLKLRFARGTARVKVEEVES